MPQEPASRFHARADARDGAVVIVAEGELDLVAVQRLADAMPPAGEASVVVDLERVGFMDSSGLRALLEARKSCVDAGRDFAIARPSPAVMRVLELVDLAGEFEILEAPPGA